MAKMKLQLNHFTPPEAKTIYWSKVSQGKKLEYLDDDFDSALKRLTRKVPKKESCYGGEIYQLIYNELGLEWKLVARKSTELNGDVELQIFINRAGE